MAEVFTASFVILSAVSLAQKCYDLANSIKDINPQVDQLKFKLKSQRRMFENWVEKMRQAVGNDLEFAVPAKDIDDVREIIEKLDEYLRTAERMYSKIDPETIRRTSKLTQLRVKTDFILQSSKRIERIVDTLKELNKYLEMIAVPPPPYLQPEVKAKRAELSESPTINRTPSQAEDVNASSSELNATSQLENTSRGFTATAIPSRPYAIPSAMVSLCFNMLSIAKNNQGDSRTYLENAIGRLKLWEAGLFEPSASLDDLIHEGRASAQPVRRMFLKCVSMLLAHLENILKIMYQRQASRDLIDALQRVNVALGSEDLRPYLVQQLEIALEPDEKYEGSIDSQHFPIATQQDVEDARAVSRIVECLFELLPSIAILRQNHWFGRSTIQKEQTRPLMQNAHSSHPSPSSVSQIPKKDIQTIVLYLRKIDQGRLHGHRSSSRSSKQVDAYEPIFKKEVERLLELENLHKLEDVKGNESKAAKLITSLLEDIQSQDSKFNHSSENVLGYSKESRIFTDDTMHTFDSEKTLVSLQSREDDVQFFLHSLKRLAANDRADW